MKKLNNNPQLRIISLGWGVQSFALAAMSALGELPPVDAAIHADTTHERLETYKFAERWTPWLERHGVRVLTTSDRKAARKLYGESGQTHLPAFTIKKVGGNQGQLRRSCTQRWKIAPQRRVISTLLFENRIKKTPGVVEQWFGITLDEWSRMRDSDVRYVANHYPFMEFDPPMTRHAVMRWLQDNNLEIPVKSACVFCPYHNRAGWREIRDAGNGDWDKALKVDCIIRDKRPGYLCYLTNQRVPLDEADFSTPQDHGQLELWGEECTGNCFL